MYVEHCPDNCLLLTPAGLQPNKHPAESWDEQHCRKILTVAIGCSIPFDVFSWRPWVLSRKVAERYSVGNVFLYVLSVASLKAELN
jgi:hypothetical protein